jgi:hypothetical protein
LFCHLYASGATAHDERADGRAANSGCLASTGIAADTFFVDTKHQSHFGLIRVFLGGQPSFRNLKVRLYRGLDPTRPGPEVHMPARRLVQDSAPGWHFEPLPPGDYVVIASSDSTATNGRGLSVRAGDAYSLFIVLR